MAIDDGHWSTASLLIPVPDPIDKVKFGGSHAQLEVIAAYREGLRKLEKAHAESDKKSGAKGKGKDGKGHDKADGE